MNLILFAAAVVLASCVVVLLALLWRGRRRQRALERLLDSTDALEALLHTTKERMAAMKQVVGRVAPDIGAEAQASLDADAPVQQGLRNVLEHRLWIARNVDTASVAQLEQAQAALQRSHQQIASRLAQLESAGAELAIAARAVAEQEAREPSSLRRPPESRHD